MVRLPTGSSWSNQAAASEAGGRGIAFSHVFLELRGRRETRDLAHWKKLTPPRGAAHAAAAQRCTAESPAPRDGASGWNRCHWVFQLRIVPWAS